MQRRRPAGDRCPRLYGAHGWASRILPRPYGRQICPSCMWPARTRSNTPSGSEVDDAREVAQEDAEVRVGVGELPRPRRDSACTCADRPRRAGRAGRGARASPPRPGAASRVRGRPRRPASRTDRGCPRSRGCRARRRPGAAARHRAQPRGSARPREQVAGDHDQIRLPLGHPVRRALDRAGPRRRRAEVEVGEMGDPQPGELGRQPRERDSGTTWSLTQAAS